MGVSYENIVRVGKVSSVDASNRTKSGLRNWARKISGIMKRGTIRKIEGSNWAKAM